jgi:hypothetical protein
MSQLLKISSRLCLGFWKKLLDYVSLFTILSKLCLDYKYSFSILSQYVPNRLKYILTKVDNIDEYFLILSRKIFQKPIITNNHYAFILSKIDHPLSSSNSYETIRGGGQSSDKSFMNILFSIDNFSRRGV